jgi:hypothetical protein
MGLFLLADGTHKGLDKHRNNFFWEDKVNKRKYHMVSWEEICKPKEQGGLGVMNTKKMNIALMLKWIWRILTEQDERLLWLQLIRAKYGTAELLSGRASGGSPFWKSIQKIKHMFSCGVRFHVGNGQHTRFWLDHWLGEDNFSVKFPLIFEICAEPEISVAQAITHEGWNIRLRRSLGPTQVMQWQSLVALLESYQLEEASDRISWKLDASGVYTTRSMYAAMCQDQAVVCSKLIWQAQVPKKIKIFTWQLLKGRLPSSDNICLRGGPSNGMCVLCGTEEDVDHIFFKCVLALFMWEGLSLSLGVQWKPRNRQEWLTILGGFRGATRRILWILFAAMCWALWKIRNKFTIEKTFPNQPAECIFHTLINLQQWRPLLRSSERRLADELITTLKDLSTQTLSRPQSRSGETVV